MATQTILGLRERKKLQMRQLISDRAQHLFAKRGFDAVTVAEVARAADVSEVTVFNYFPTKEELFYGGMSFFEEELVAAVRDRKSGESVVAAFSRVLLAGADQLGSPERAKMIVRAARAIGTSPGLRARERDIIDRYTDQLAALIAEETHSPQGDVEPAIVARALMGAHRALVEHARREAHAGRRGAALVADMRKQTRRAFARLEAGLAGYDVKKR
jgi:AcrR family transcriptional regulator